ncbi:MAG: haloacid dehalogenase-like hydrolase [Verrucomicrobia bacterium]|nr:haloacid dehalogenase-like hydrolase [Verrucomicrobiota bacterium]MCF7707858.1 haloacid dehalogenase-like hydrolase [Verrucomicrobiota bacterium]
MTELVLFDIDGTLIRTRGAGVNAFECAFKTEFNISDPTDKIHFAGRTDTGIVRDFFNAYGISATPDNFRRFFDCYSFWLDHLLRRSPGGILPGVWSFICELNNLSNPPLIGLLTGNIRLGAEIKLRHFQLWDHFVTGAFGDDHEDRGQLAVIAADRAGRITGESIHGDKILVIGDTPFDIQCAKTIDAKTLAVATGPYSVQELKQYSPTWAVENLAGITPSDVGCRCRA